MSSPDRPRFIRLPRAGRLALAFAAALALAGCFQPMYGDSTLAGDTPLRARMQQVDVMPVEAPMGSAVARIGVELRNQLTFGLTGGAGTQSPTYRLKIVLIPSRQATIVDTVSGRADIEDYGLDAVYTLTEIGTGRAAAQGNTFTRVTFNVPGQVQRFARARGLRDAEDRAAKEIADNITRRVASYFVAGG